MHKFETRGIALLTAPADMLTRLLMCVLPAIAFTNGGLAMRAALALFLGLTDGWSRWWGSCTSLSFAAKPEGLTIASTFRVRVVPWENVAAIQTWHHFNQLDYAAIHYRHAGRIEVASCCDQYGEDDLRDFVRACAESVSQPPSITLAGLCERRVALPLFRRFAVDVALASVVGLALGVAFPAFLLSLLAASTSTLFAALRYRLRTTTLLLKDGLWCCEARPLRTVPRALRLWVRCLSDARCRVASSG
jgi:hypothetical protein